MPYLLLHNNVSVINRLTLSSEYTWRDHLDTVQGRSFIYYKAVKKAS